MSYNVREDIQNDLALASKISLICACAVLLNASIFDSFSYWTYLSITAFITYSVFILNGNIIASLFGIILVCIFNYNIIIFTRVGEKAPAVLFVLAGVGFLTGFIAALKLQKLNSHE